MTNKKHGLKYDEGKLPWDLLPFRAVEGMLAVLAFGESKYGKHNWRGGFVWSRLVAAAFRHLSAVARGEFTDAESGLQHIDHALCCVAFLSESMKAGYGEDDINRL